MNVNEFKRKYVSDIKCISHVEIKEEIILPEDSSDSESTLSDNDRTSDIKSGECSICCKYRSMFVILKNHECEPGEKCKKCGEISHWADCFRRHRERHEVEGEFESDSTASDKEESPEKCRICLRYEFMVPILKNHLCRIGPDDDGCRDCSEFLNWTVCYKNHVDSHELSSSDSTASDGEETQKIMPRKREEECRVCRKYEVTMIIMKENHGCEVREKGNDCAACNEISDWRECYERHKKSHGTKNGQIVLDRGNFECGICLKLNSLLERKRHACEGVKTCEGCREASYWASCFENHRKVKNKRNWEGRYGGENFKEVSLGGDQIVSETSTFHNRQEPEQKSDWEERSAKVRETQRNGNDGLFGPVGERRPRADVGTNKEAECGICLKLNSIIGALVKNHECEDSKRCEMCDEISYWVSCLKNHEKVVAKVGEISADSHVFHQDSRKTKKLSEQRFLRGHEGGFMPLKNFFSCSNCGKRFSGEKMLNVHKSYCKNVVNILAPKKHKLLQSCRLSPDEKHICRMCKINFPNLCELKNHQAVPDFLC